MVVRCHPKAGGLHEEGPAMNIYIPSGRDASRGRRAVLEAVWDAFSEHPTEVNDGSICYGQKEHPKCRVSGQGENPEHLSKSTEPSRVTAQGRGSEGSVRRGPEARPHLTPRHRQELRIYYHQQGCHWAV